MDEAQKGKLVALIKKTMTETDQEILRLKELTKPISPENAIGRVSRMDAINNKTINDAALRKAEEKIKKLRFALKKSKEKSFGQCARCGQNIPIGRLMLMPQSNRCVHCAER